MAYSLPDKTGTDPRYRIIGDRYTIRDRNQKIVFDPSNGPIYRESLKIFKLVTSLEKGSTTATRLVEQKDYRIETDDIDLTSMSKLYTMEDIQKEIIKSVTFTLSDVPILVSMDYQCVYNANPDSDPNSVGGTVDLTPDTIIDIYRKLSNIELQFQASLNVTALPKDFNLPKLLRFDINKELDENLITDEVYTVNTYIRHNAIFPKYGSFFRDSIVVKDQSDKVLKLNEDYLIQLDNLGLTKLSANKSGINDCILFIKEFTGDVKITYHAVGGKICVQDISSLKDNLTAMREYLSKNDFVTENGLNQTDVIKLHGQKLQELDEKMRQLLTGSPTYGDTTTGKVSIRDINQNVSGLRWFTVAVLNTVTGSSDLVNMDRFICNLTIPSQGYQADIIVTACINPLMSNGKYGEISVINSLDPAKDKYNYLTDTNLNKVNPVLYRILTDPGVGAVFQVGITDPIGKLAVEDRSGVESCWKLVLSDNSNNLPQEPKGGWGDNDNVIAPAFNNPSSQITIDPNNDRSGYRISPHNRILWQGNQEIDNNNQTSFDIDDFRLYYNGLTVDHVELGIDYYPPNGQQDFNTLIIPFYNNDNTTLTGGTKLTVEQSNSLSIFAKIPTSRRTSAQHTLSLVFTPRCSDHSVKFNLRQIRIICK